MDNRNTRPPGGNPPPRDTPRPQPRPNGGNPPPNQGSGGEQQGGGGKKKRKVKSRWGRAIIMVLCTLGLCAFLSIFLLQSANELFGLQQESEQIEVVIPDNASIKDITGVLSKAGVIEKSLTFRVYASLQKDEQYYGGTYIFNTDMGYDEILTKLRTKVSQKEIVEISFAEGLNVYEIAKLLEEERVCDAQEFLDYLEECDFSFEFMDQMPQDARRFRRLEGYLFPDTYEFYVEENVQSVARKFLVNFNTKITGDMRNRMQTLNMTLDETITLASIIQKEAGDPDEMRLVSSVFHNRLNLPAVYPKLQSDVTKHYVNNFIIPFHDLRNQEMYDAYNTYECNGLSIGPICNPGMAAINAALYPADTNNYFFVTDVEERFYYAETAQDHYANVRTASNVQGEGKIHGTDTE